MFRLHPADASVAATAAAAAAAGAVRSGSSGGVGVTASSPSSSSSNGRVVSSIDIQLPHNSLLIMWPPTQEEWKHEVRVRQAGRAART